MSSTEYRIPASNLELLERELAKLNKAAAKLNLDPIGFTEVKREMVKRPTTDPYEPVSYAEFVTVTIQGGVPIIAGWQFMAVIEHGIEGEGNIVRRVPGHNEDALDLTRYRTATSWCDHCNVNRRRNDTYVVWNADQNDIMQVGSSCLRDFIGHGDPNAVARFAERFIAVLDSIGGGDDDEWGSGGGSYERYYSAEDVLTATSAVINTFGWRSRTNYPNNDATADDVSEVLYKGWNPDWKHPVPATDGEVAKVIEWVRSDELGREADNARTDYLHNLRVVLAKDHITVRRLGIACSAIMAYRRAEQRRIEREAAVTTSEWVGEVGKRQPFNCLTCSNIRELDNGFFTILYTFVTFEGNIVKWFSSNRLYMQDGTLVEQGTCVNLVASVKKHDEYQGVKQTVITRGKVQ